MKLRAVWVLVMCAVLGSAVSGAGTVTVIVNPGPFKDIETAAVSERQVALWDGDLAADRECREGFAGGALARRRRALQPPGATARAVALPQPETDGSPPPDAKRDTQAPRWGVLLSGGNGDRSLLARAIASCAS